MEAGNASDESDGTIDESKIEEESVEVTEKSRKRKFKMPKLSKPNVPKGNGSIFGSICLCQSFFLTRISVLFIQP